MDSKIPKNSDEFKERIIELSLPYNALSNLDSSSYDSFCDSFSEFLKKKYGATRIQTVIDDKLKLVKMIMFYSKEKVLQ